VSARWGTTKELCRKARDQRKRKERKKKVNLNQDEPRGIEKKCDVTLIQETGWGRATRSVCAPENPLREIPGITLGGRISAPCIIGGEKMRNKYFKNLRGKGKRGEEIRIALKIALKDKR